METKYKAGEKGKNQALVWAVKILVYEEWVGF